MRKLLADLVANISAIDKKIDALINGDETLSKQHQQLCSIDGIGGNDEEKEGELREYYLRKVAEGKNKMSVLNAIREK